VDPEGGYVVRFPDLLGCVTQAETIEEIGAMAEEARVLWIETEYEAGEEIPLPSQSPDYSGRFNLRLPKSLHARLAESAERDGVSLNQYVIMLTAAGEAALASSRMRHALDVLDQGSEQANSRLAQLREMFLDYGDFEDLNLLQAALDRLQQGATGKASTEQAKAVPRRRR
jgi:predicted RNase H-like HicB family nuclease